MSSSSALICTCQMGNFVTSCTTGFVESSPKGAARILLVDGSTLKFTAPMTVSKLLAQYPNHAVCALGSLKPGLHALSSLLPQEKLKMGGLYLLLPVKPRTQKARTSGNRCNQAMPERPPKKGMPERPPKKAPAQAVVGAHESREAPKKRGDVGRLGGAPPRRNGELGCRISSSKAEMMENGKVGPLQKEDEQVQPSYRASGRRREGPEGRRRRQSVEMHCQKERHCPDETTADGRPIRPICRSVSVRRSTSWVPRLQPILERF